MKKFFAGGGTVIRVAIAGIIIAVLVVSFYYYLSKRLSSHEEDFVQEKSELELVLEKDFLNEYPETPKKVMEWYTRILRQYYSDDVGNSEVEQLCDQARMMLDQDILAANSRLDFISAVKQEKESFKNRSKKISSTMITNTITGSQGRKDLAGVTVLFSVQEKGTFSNFYQTYNLKRDGAGKYKIYSFAVTDEDGNPIVGNPGLGNL